MENDGVQLLVGAKMLHNLEDNQTIIFGNAFSIRQKYFHPVSFLRVNS